MRIRNWQEWERYCARDGRRVKGSGNRVLKGDVVRDQEVVECKFTTREYYTLSLRDLQYLTHAARQHHARPVFELYIAGVHIRLEQEDEYRYPTDRRSWRIRPQMVGERIETPYGRWAILDGTACDST